MSVRLIQNGIESQVVLEGIVDIASAAEVKAVLSRGLAAGQPLIIHLEDIRYLDVTAMQLLWAAAREAKQTGMRVSFSGRSHEPASSLLSAAGFSNLSDSDVAA